MSQTKSRTYCQLLEIPCLQGNVVAFALLMTPFATNPLIYVASDPNYRRCPQIDAATISFRESSIREPKESLAPLVLQVVKYFRAYRDCLCQPLRRNSMAEVDILLATELLILSSIQPTPGLDNPDGPPKCETLSGGARPPHPGHRHEQPPPGSFQSHLQDPHNLLLVCLSLF